MEPEQPTTCDIEDNYETFFIKLDGSHIIWIMLFSEQAFKIIHNMKKGMTKPKRAKAQPFVNH